MSFGRTAIAFLALIAAVSATARVTAEELDKAPIIEQWRTGIQPLKDAYTNCQIAGQLHWDMGFDGDGLELLSSFRFASRGSLKRLDITNAQLLARLNEHWIIGKDEAYTVFRDEADQPYKLWRRAVERDLEKYEAMRRMTPYTMIRNHIIASGPYSVQGMEGPEYLARKSVALYKDERPDPKHPSKRKFQGTFTLSDDQPPFEFSVTIDERLHWAVVEFTYDVPKVKSTNKMFYSNADGIPKLQKVEQYADVKGHRAGLASEYRLTEVIFQAPDEKDFTLASFGIPETAEAEGDK